MQIELTQKELKAMRRLGKCLTAGLLVSTHEVTQVITGLVRKADAPSGSLGKRISTDDKRKEKYRQKLKVA